MTGPPDDGACPCGRPLAYAECCRPLHVGERHAPTAEHLMRARYSAFARGERGYLESTWHSATRPTDVRVDPTRAWTRLEVVGATAGGLLDQEGTVSFEAHSRRGGRDDVLREVSRFVREDGRWVYVGPLDDR